MIKTQQIIEDMSKEEFSQKLEKAKQIYCLLNDITFGNERESALSRMRLNRLN